MSSRLKPLFVGLGPSTQDFSWLVTDGQEIVDYGEVNYAGRLGGKYPLLTEGGYGKGPNNYRFTLPGMFLDSTDLVLQDMFIRLGREGMRRIRVIATAAQQHGSWCGAEALPGLLGGLSPQGGLLSEQLAGGFSRRDMTHWSCKVALPQCERMHGLIGDQKVLAMTGSMAQSRFLVPLLMHIHQHEEGVLDRTAHIGLVNSLVTSALIQRLAPIGYGDALGTNGVDITADPFTWWAEGFNAVGLSSVLPKLPTLVPSSHVVGRIGKYFARYSLSPQHCNVLAGEGDNCDSNTAAGALQEGEMTADLGSSFTAMKKTDTPQPDPSGIGSTFGAGSGGCITLFMPTYTSGLMQDTVCKDHYGNEYSQFDAEMRRLTLSDQPHKLAYMLVPRSDGSAFDRHKIGEGADTEQNALACVQGLLADLVRRIGDTKISRITVNGTAATPYTCQVLADMTGAEVTLSEVKDGPALGAAIRAAQSFQSLPWRRYVDALSPMGETFLPRAVWHDYYRNEYMPKFLEHAPAID